jgi:hypothetical protein
MYYCVSNLSLQNQSAGSNDLFASPNQGLGASLGIRASSGLGGSLGVGASPGAAASQNRGTSTPPPS